MNSSPSTRRIARIRLVMFAGAALVCAYLYSMMVVHQEDWLDLSRRNRWAFRDVPTKRGAILDRQGRPVVADEPTFRLEFQYRTLRRRHPVAAVLHAVALLDGLPVRYSETAVTEGFTRLMAAEVAELHRGDGRARDLRYYLGSLLLVLPPDIRTKTRNQLHSASGPGTGTIGTCLGPVKDTLEQELALRIAELEQLDARTQDDGGIGLLARLDALADSVQAAAAEKDQARVHSLERRFRTVVRDMSFDDAATVHQMRERHPGLFVHHDVRREMPADLVALLPSLPSIVGRTSPLFAEDLVGLARDPTADVVEEVLQPALHELFASGADDLEVEPEAEASARLLMEQKLRRRMVATQRVGRFGVEQAGDEVLSGRPGMRWVERDRRTLERGLWLSLDVMPGRDQHLSIDLELQRLAEAIIDAHAPDQPFLALALIDPWTGDVLALAGRPLAVPEGDPHPSASTTSEVKPVPLTYPPGTSWWNAGDLGSVVKPFILLEHLDAVRTGRPHLEPGQMDACEQQYRRARHSSGRYLRCDGWHAADRGNPVLALARSCNVYFYELSRGLDEGGVLRAMQRAGFEAPSRNGPHIEGGEGWYQGQPSGVRSPGRARIYDRARPLPLRAIGYGVAASVLDVARAYAGLATGALPTLDFRRTEPGAERPRVDLQLAPEDLAIVHEGLLQCTQLGTGSRIASLRRLRVHGKTGTAEVRSSTANAPALNNAWFAGFLGMPARLAFAAVVYDVPGHGAAESGLLIGELLTAIAEDPELAARYLPPGVR